VVDKIRKKLSSWKGKCISMAGRITLIKAVISSLPLYMFSPFKAPKAVCQEINKIQRQFLWDWDQDRKKIAWVS